MSVSENADVKAGDPLFQIDPERYQNAVAQARADLALAEATLETQRKLVATQGPDPSAWRASATAEEIKFRPLELITMRYTNRPSGIQQVISFFGHGPRS